ncbi:MAG: hypothetical protein J6B28_05805 [Eubacterium sp.]|nr:hypothetical protein [Eubacterium sp.]
MKIVFWGETKRCGTTSNMLAVAGMLSVLRPDVRVEVRTLGLAQRSMRPYAGEEKSFRKDSDDTERVSCNENQNMHFCFFDCGSGKDKRRRDILRQADLVVVNLVQDEAALQEFFMYDIHIAPNILILMGKYYELSGYGRGYLERFYRIGPETIGVIPCNAAFEKAADKGKVRQFVQMESQMSNNKRNQELLQELTHFVELLLQNAGELQCKKEKQHCRIKTKQRDEG